MYHRSISGWEPGVWFDTLAMNWIDKDRFDLSSEIAVTKANESVQVFYNLNGEWTTDSILVSSDHNTGDTFGQNLSVDYEVSHSIGIHARRV